MMQEKKSLLAFSATQRTLLLYGREVTNIHPTPEALSRLRHTEQIMGSGFRPLLHRQVQLEIRRRRNCSDEFLFLMLRV